MTSEEFLEEVLKSDICPKNFEEIYKDFQTMQKLVLDALREFHRVCEKNNIHYQLAYGSLLGAIRDGGQIPWDYDVDVFVPIDERLELIEALKKDLDNKFYFYCPEVDPKCRHYFIRVTPVGYRSEVMHVDVFYLMGGADDKGHDIESLHEIKRLTRRRFGKLVIPSQNAYGSGLRYFGFLVYNIVNYFVDLSKDYQLYENIVKKYSLNQSKIIVPVSPDGICCRLMREDVLFRIKKTVLSDCFYIPVGYDKILHVHYGDYKLLPPLEDRIKAVMGGCHVFKMYSRSK